MSESQIPSQRYLKREEIRRTEHCVEYRAIDHLEGTEVLWHEYSIGPDSPLRQNLIDHVVIFGKIKHPNLINLYSARLDKSKNILYFLTEYFANQTLSSYVKNVGHNLTRTAIGNWVSQIMDGLEVLHSRSPPFTHGDVRCDNIFIDPSEGVVKLGIPDLDIFLNQEAKPLQSPEAQKYINDPKNDVWSLGMAILEMITSKKPFSDIHSEMQIREAIKTRLMPPEFLEVDDPIIADFIQVCISPIDQRPSIPQLRDHPLFAEVELSEDSTSKTKDDFINIEIPESIKANPAFIALLQRQNAERQELLQKHEKQKAEAFERIKQRLMGPLK